MSLKVVHICFIVAATALAVGFGFWGLRNYSRPGEGLNLFLGAGSFLAAVALVIYLFWFLSEMKKVGPK